jgi:hypothetical protein
MRAIGRGLCAFQEDVAVRHELHAARLIYHGSRSWTCHRQNILQHSKRSIQLLGTWLPLEMSTVIPEQHVGTDRDNKGFGPISFSGAAVDDTGADSVDQKRQCGDKTRRSSADLCTG